MTEESSNPCLSIVSENVTKTQLYHAIEQLPAKPTVKGATRGLPGQLVQILKAIVKPLNKELPVFHKDQNQNFKTVATIADETNLSESSCRRGLHKLALLGYIEIIERHKGAVNRSNVYKCLPTVMIAHELRKAVKKSDLVAAKKTAKQLSELALKPQEKISVERGKMGVLGKRRKALAAAIKRQEQNIIAIARDAATNMELFSALDMLNSELETVESYFKTMVTKVRELPVIETKSLSPYPKSDTTLLSSLEPIGSQGQNQLGGVDATLLKNLNKKNIPVRELTSLENPPTDSAKESGKQLKLTGDVEWLEGIIERFCKAHRYSSKRVSQKSILSFAEQTIDQSTRSEVEQALKILEDNPIMTLGDSHMLGRLLHISEISRLTKILRGRIFKIARDLAYFPESEIDKCLQGSPKVWQKEIIPDEMLIAAVKKQIKLIKKPYSTDDHESSSEVTDANINQEETHANDHDVTASPDVSEKEEQYFFDPPNPCLEKAVEQAETEDALEATDLETTEQQALQDVDVANTEVEITEDITVKKVAESKATEELAENINVEIADNQAVDTKDHTSDTVQENTTVAAKPEVAEQQDLEGATPETSVAPETGACEDNGSDRGEEIADENLVENTKNQDIAQNAPNSNGDGSLKSDTQSPHTPKKSHSKPSSQGENEQISESDQEEIKKLRAKICTTLMVKVNRRDTSMTSYFLQIIRTLKTLEEWQRIVNIMQDFADGKINLAA